MRPILVSYSTRVPRRKDPLQRGAWIALAVAAFTLGLLGWWWLAPGTAEILPADGRKQVPLARKQQAPLIPLADEFKRRGLSYPPKGLALLVFKQEHRMGLWALEKDGWRHVRNYKVLAASGRSGPKLLEGDKQVPEGVYRIVSANPNSAYHKSLKLNYPNTFDRKMARADGRIKLGGDICIHGKDVSIGCVAIGDAAISEVYAACEATGLPKITVVIAPNDLRSDPPKSTGGEEVSWLPMLYKEITRELSRFPIEAEQSPTGEAPRPPVAPRAAETLGGPPAASKPSPRARSGN